MKKIIVLLFVSMFILNESKAQNDFMQSFGVSYHIYQSNQTIPSKFALYGVNYTPRLLLLPISDLGGLSVASPIGAGLSLSNNPNFNFFMLNVPIVAEIAFGHQADLDNDFPVGVFAGLGFEYSYISSINLSTFVPIASFGGRANFFGRSITIRVNKALVIKEEGPTISFSLGTNMAY